MGGGGGGVGGGWEVRANAAADMESSCALNVWRIGIAPLAHFVLALIFIAF